MKNKALLVLIALCFASVLDAQVNPFNIRKYEFIEYDENSIIVNDNPNIDHFFCHLDTLILQGRGKINIVHIGDSHIQADYVSGQVRKRFQEMAWGLNGGRGFIFPVQIAKTNNPWNYRARYSGSWETCKNVEHSRSCPIGLAGFVATTKSQKASIHITLTDKDYPEYYFTSLRVFHNMDTANWSLHMMDTTLEYEITHHIDSAYSLISFAQEQTFLDLEIIKRGETGEFILHGLSLDNEDPGIVYHSVGVNGAEVESWLKCSLLGEELTLLEPDLVIISLGTNDSYTSKFDAPRFEENMKELLNRVKEASPDAAILWVTPGDNYRYRRYLNYSTGKATEVILNVAKEQNIMVWDFYDVMGELNAIMNWYYAGLTAKDKLHYNQRGYELQGNLMFNAFLRAYNQHIDKK